MYVSVNSESSNSECGRDDSECSEDIVDHLDGQLNRGTLEIWTQKKNLYNRREKIRKIKKYETEKKILHNSSLFRFLGMSDMVSNDVSSLNNIERLEDSDWVRNSQKYISTSTPVKSSDSTAVGFKLKSIDDENPILLNCEIVEIFDTFEKTKVQCIEESGPVETEIIDCVDINNVYEDIHLEDHGIDDQEIVFDHCHKKSSRSPLNSTSSLLRGSTSSEFSFHTSVNENNNSKHNKWDTNSTIAEEYSKPMSMTNTCSSFMEDDYVIIDYENNHIVCRDSKSSSLLLFMQ